ncbi:MAG: hypothetical protein WD512_15195, partial [Candidatus Paceibacterota bacterium]
EAMATFQKYIDCNKVNQSEGQVTFVNIKELIDKKVKFFVTVNGWFSTYEAEIDLVFDDINSRFLWKYNGSMAIWHRVEIKKYSSHIYINNEVIYYKP